MAASAASADDAFGRHKRRKDRVWTNRSAWDKIYSDCYEFAIPERRPSKQGAPKQKIDRLYDMTAPVSTFHFAGTLQRDLFPAGQEPFWLTPGAIPKVAVSKGTMPRQGLAVLERELYDTSSLIHPFFATGEWDMAVHEMCLDLGIGFGGLYPAKGTRDNPVRFVSVPADDLAVENDMYGDTCFISWKQELTRYAIYETFPDATYPEGFRDKIKGNSADEMLWLYQDFIRLPDRRWRFVLYIDESTRPMGQNTYRTKPIATPRYYRVPGEAYGRGPVMLAMPSIKTLNKAQEFALKAAAIEMLGIWGYRAGGSFNPDTVRLGPGEFWPMMATGGVLGPDVTRLNPTGGRLDVASMVIGSLQEQIKAVLLDMRLPDPGTTPASASEIVARMTNRREAHLGAFGRLVRELMPVIVPRVIEILYDYGYLAAPLPINELLVSIDVVSPMSQALKAGQLVPSMSYVEIVAAMRGPQEVDTYVKMDNLLDRIARDTRVPPDELNTPMEREAIRKQKQAEQAAAMAAAVALQAGQAAPAAENQAGASPIRVAA